MQVLRETAKVPNGLRIAVWPYRRQRHSTADVDPRRVPAHCFQTGIIGPDPFLLPRQRPNRVRFRLRLVRRFLPLHSYCWRGTARSRLITCSFQRGQTASFEAAATKPMIDRTGARLYHGQERANVDSAITRDAFAVLFLPQDRPARQVVSGPHDVPRASWTLSEYKWTITRERRRVTA